MTAAAVFAQPDRNHPPFSALAPGSRLIETKRIDEPLELKQGAADAEAIIAGQSYWQFVYGVMPDTAVSTVDFFIAYYRDALFTAGWKMIDVTAINPASPPATANVAAHLRHNGNNIYARVSLLPDKRYHVNVADVGAEDWDAQLARDCRIRIHSIHFEHDRPIIQEVESEPTLRKLADLIKAKRTPSVRIEGHMDNIGEAGRDERDTLSLGRARMVMSWLTTEGKVPPDKVTAHGMGRSRPVAYNDTDLGRALNRRIEVARTDCTR